MQDMGVNFVRQLSQRLQKSKATLNQVFQDIPSKNRDDVDSKLMASGVIEIFNYLIPILEKGDLSDPCFNEHEVAKGLYSLANICSYWSDAGNPNWWTYIATASQTAGCVLDIVSQTCNQSEQEQWNEYVQAQFTLIEGWLSWIMDLVPGESLPPTPEGSKPVSLTDLELKLDVTKKFYKFEGIPSQLQAGSVPFTPTFSKDKIRILIEQPYPIPYGQPTLIALLVTGFIDLSQMRDGDVVTITTRVGRLDVALTSPFAYSNWRVKTYTGQQMIGMKHFQDFADIQEIPADGVEVLICQSASADDFKTSIQIPFWFVIESTTVPNYTVQ